MTLDALEDAIVKAKEFLQRAIKYRTEMLGNKTKTHDFPKLSGAVRRSQWT